MKEILENLVWPQPTAEETLQVRAGRLLHCLCYGVAFVIVLWVALGINEGLIGITEAIEKMSAAMIMATLGRLLRYALSGE